MVRSGIRKDRSRFILLGCSLLLLALVGAGGGCSASRARFPDCVLLLRFIIFVVVAFESSLVGKIAPVKLCAFSEAILCWDSWPELMEKALCRLLQKPLRTAVQSVTYSQVAMDGVLTSDVTGRWNSPLLLFEVRRCPKHEDAP